MGYQENAALLLECRTCLLFRLQLFPLPWPALRALYAGRLTEEKRVSAAFFALLLSCTRLVGNPGKRSEVMCLSSPFSSRLCRRVTRLVKEVSSRDCRLGDSVIRLCLLFELSVSNSTVACPQDNTVIVGPSVYPTFIFKPSSSHPNISALSPKILTNDSLILSWNLPSLILFVGG